MRWLGAFGFPVDASRAHAEFDSITWADFIQADRMGDAYQMLVSRTGRCLSVIISDWER